MLNEKDGLFKNFDVEFKIDLDSFPWAKKDVNSRKEGALIDSINKNKEVAGLLNIIEGDYYLKGIGRYSPGFIFKMLCFAKVLLNNLLLQHIDQKIKKEGVLSRTIFNGVIGHHGEIQKRIDKLPLDTTAKDVRDCFKTKGFFFDSKDLRKYNLSKIWISSCRVYKILYVLEKVGPDNCNSETIQNAIKEINEVMSIMIDAVGNFRFFGQWGDITCYNVFENEVKEEAKKADAITDNTQTLTLNRPKQQENKLLTVGNKKAYQVGKGDYQHRNGVIKEEKAEMSKIYTYPVADNSDLADLEDILNNIIDNPDTVDELVNYLAKNAPAAHFISEMVDRGEIDNEESLIGALNKATSLSQGMIAAGKNVRVQGGEYKVFNYLNIDYPKPIFGREFSLKQLSFCFDVAAREIEDIFVKAKAEEEAEEQEEEKEEVTPDEAVQNYAGYSVEELEKLLEERDKEEAEVDAEIKQAEEEARRKELVEQLLAKDKRIAEKKALRDKLRGK